METQLCRCNNCGTIMIDENPDDQPELTAPENVKNMKELNDIGGFYWACPECLTDEYLQDMYEL